MKSVCDPNACFACSACENICPKQCIVRHQRDDSSWFMEIDESKCINCKLCEQICPNVSGFISHPVSEAYAAWSSDSVIHKTAASGGIASEIYRYAAEKGWFFCGVGLDSAGNALFSITKDVADIEKFRNSKYTFSFMNDIYQKIVEQLKNEQTVVFVGLPCQVAALKNYAIKNRCERNLISVDLVCHGTPSPEYLKQHIQYVSNKAKKEVSECYFRDSSFGTNSFAFTAYTKQEQRPFYVKYVDQDDNYQIGYHKAIIYRECCYRCKFAQNSRCGDITLGDYHGLGQESRYEHEKNEVSVVLINTEVGRTLINEMRQQERIVAYARPIAEPLKHERQLNGPSVAPLERESFLKYFKDEKNFDRAANLSFENIKKKNKLRRMFPIHKLKQFVVKMIPRRLKEFLKELERKFCK